MDEYDEDLSENSWYLAFIHNHNKLFLQVTNGRWIICVPRSGSWKGGGEAAKTFGSSYFESHCIKYEGEEVLHPKKEADAEPTPKRINKYTTYNGKTVLAEGSKLCCGPGFEEAATSFDSRSGQLDLPPSGLNHFAKILFEETYFNVNDQSYKMLCVSRPLELHLAIGQDAGQGTEDSPLSPTSELRLADKLHSHHLWSRASKPEKLKRSVDAKIGAYIKNHGFGKAVCEQAMQSLNEDDILEMDEITGIDSCMASVNILFNTCFQIVMKDIKIKREMETNPFDTTKNALEKYVLQEVHGSVFRQISSAIASQEAAFNKVICNLSDIQPRDLEIEEKYWVSLPRAKRHLSRINKYCTPQDKLSCLQQTVFCITAKRENTALGSDDLLPILIYLIIKCSIPNWLTNLMYLHHFQLVQFANEQHSFYLTTLEAAIEHIKQGGLKVPTFFSSKQETGEVSPVRKYFQDVWNGNLPAVKDILSKSARERKVREQEMCHPLCTCEKCIKLKRRSASRSEPLITVNTRDDKGQTGLHIAATTGHHEIVDILVEYGADLNGMDYHGSTPLHCAALSGSQSVVFLLLHHGANPNATDNNSNTPLHLCSQRGHEACAKAFLYFDPTATVPSVDMANDEGDRPLHVASKWGYVGIVAALIECGANPTAPNRRRQSSIDVSLNDKVVASIKIAASQVIKIVRTLKHLDATKDMEQSPSKKQQKKIKYHATMHKELDNTIDSVYVAKQVEKLFRAVKDNDVNMVKFLCGWRTNEENEKAKLSDPPCDPLCQCTKCQPLSPEHVLHANSSNPEKYTGLMVAAKSGYLEMAKLFLEQGAIVNARTKRHGYSPLHFACENGKTEMVKLILYQNGANPDIRDANGSTPLYMCAINNFPDCADALLQGNASVNIRNHNGDTPLHVAVKWKNGDVVGLLLGHGALAYYKNNDGLTPIDLADKDSSISNQLLTASAVEGGLSLAATLGVSPHSPLSDGLTSSAVEESPTSLTPLNPDSRSIDDEVIADDLYAKFKDPAPPTPPLGSCGSRMSAEKNQAKDKETDSQLECSLNEDDSICDIREEITNGLLTKDPSQRSVTSDIFQDLLHGEVTSSLIEDGDIIVQEVRSSHDDDIKEKVMEQSEPISSKREEDFKELIPAPPETAGENTPGDKCETTLTVSKFAPTVDDEQGSSVPEELKKSPGDTYFEIG